MSRHLSLRARFLLFAVACLLPLLVVVAFFLDRGIERNTQQLVSAEGSLAQVINRQLRTQFKDNTETFSNLSHQPEVFEMRPSAAGTTLGQYQTALPEISGIFLLDADGTLVAQSGQQPGPVLTGNSALFQQVISSGTSIVTGRYQLDDKTSVILMIFPVMPVSDQEAQNASSTTESVPPAPDAESTSVGNSVKPGQVVGVIGAMINTDRLAATILPYARGDTDIALVTNNQVIVGSPKITNNPDQFLHRLNNPISLSLAGDTDRTTYTDNNGTKRLVYFMPLDFDGAQWSIFVTNPTPRSYAQSLIVQSIVALALAAFVILAMAFFFGEMTARPLRLLTAQAAAIRHGQFRHSIESTGASEIHDLADAFAGMAHQIEAQMHGMDESRQEREHQAQEMRELLRRTLRLQEDERRRIASEIHDAVSPLITGALYQARAIQLGGESSTPEEQADSLASVNQLLEQASKELHSVIFDLRPPDLDDIGVVAAIRAYIKTIERTGIAAQFEVVGDSPNLTPEVRLGIYRIVQEALHNVVRHARADDVVVQLESSDEVLRVTIRDNGTGFDPTTAVQPTSLGLLSMRERAAAIGASFTIVTRPGGGTVILIERKSSEDVTMIDIDALLESEAAHQQSVATNGTGNGHAPDGELSSAAESLTSPQRHGADDRSLPRTLPA
jgi:signal transduction histidine kinase